MVTTSCAVERLAREATEPLYVVVGEIAIGLTRKPEGPGSGVRAPSIPMIRYNWVTQRLAVTWHAGDENTDIWYGYRPCSANCNYWGWEWPKVVNDNTARDQFMPALDFNSSGNTVITFYDRRNDANNFLYQQFFGYTDSTGIRLEANEQIGTLTSDPLNTFIGDY